MNDQTPRPDAGERRWKLPKWGWALFAVSMALNLLIVGSIIGMGISGHGHGHGWRGGGMRHVIRDLPDEYRDKIRAVMKDVRTKNRDDWDKVREKRRELLSYAKGDNLDPVELKRRITEINSLRHARRLRFQDEVIDVVAGMLGDLEPEMRERVLREAVGGRRKRHRRKWGKHWD